MKYVKTLDLNKTYTSKGYGDFVVLEDNTSKDVKKGSVYDP